MLEDKLLIWRFKRGNEEALCRIYDRYGDYLLTLAGTLLNDIHAAEDVVHDVFCNFIESRDKIGVNGSLKNYLATCTLNLSRDRLRSRKSHNPELDIEELNTIESTSPQANAIYGEELRNLSQAITQLTSEQREIIILHLTGAMKFREIAEIQGISINTVKSRYRYGLEKLRAILNTEGKNDGNNE